MGKINNGVYAQKGRELLARANQSTIPYVPGGMSLDGMDCQGLCEYLLIECGVPGSACNLKGSNAHYRACLWTGTPEECRKRFGSIPVGAWVFILDAEGGGEKARGYTDGLGDANHMGVYLGDCVIHASSSRKCVAESRFAGKTIPNGGWNCIGLCQWVDYGVSGLDDTISAGCTVDDAVDVLGAEEEPILCATVWSPDGNPVKMRAKPSTECDLYKRVDCGEIVTVLRQDAGTQGGEQWSQIRRGTRDWYMMTRFLRDIGTAKG